MLFIYLYVYKSFSTMIDKVLRGNIEKKRGREIGKHKLNKMGALNMKEKMSNKVDIKVKDRRVQLFLNMAAH